MSFQSQVHSFTGSSSEKSQATVVHFAGSNKIDFVPKQIPKEFPNLNGLLYNSSNLPVLKNEFFSADFVVLEYLGLWSNQIASIEPFAFQNLKNLKWLGLRSNKIQSLPFNLFQNNPKLIFLNFRWNKINSISPNLLKNLNQLKRVDFRYNQCVSKYFGCPTCSISQSDLDSGLSTCFQNCLKDPECATKSELVETIQSTPQGTTTPPPRVEDVPDSPAQTNTTASNPNPTLQSLETNLTQELAKIAEKLEAKTATLNQVLELIQSKCADDKLASDFEIAKLKQEIIDLKKETQDRENALKKEFDKTIDEIISKRLVEFKNELMNEARP